MLTKLARKEQGYLCRPPSEEQEKRSGEYEGVQAEDESGISAGFPGLGHASAGHGLSVQPRQEEEDSRGGVVKSAFTPTNARPHDSERPVGDVGGGDNRRPKEGAVFGALWSRNRDGAVGSSALDSTRGDNGGNNAAPTSRNHKSGKEENASSAAPSPSTASTTSCSPRDNDFGPRPAKLLH